MTLLGLLRNIRDGGYVYNGTIVDQWGNPINDNRLSFREGQWLMKSITCFGSAELGLGTCQCASHEPWREEVVSRATALEHIRAVLASIGGDEAARAAEIKWLERAISECVAG